MYEREVQDLGQKREILKIIIERDKESEHKREERGIVEREKETQNETKTKGENL